MEIKSSTAMETYPSTTSHTDSAASNKAAQNQSLTDELLANVDVDKVNTMFQQSVNTFKHSEKDAPRTSCNATVDCRWDQFGRC